MGTRRPATRNDLLLISGRFNENVGTRTVLAAGRSLALVMCSSGGAGPVLADDGEKEIDAIGP